MKKKKKPDFLLVNPHIYPIDVLFTTKDHKAIVKYIEEKKGYRLSDSEKANLEAHGRGRTVQLRGGQVVVWCRPEETKLGFDLSTLAHELVHATNFIFGHIGHKVNTEDDEPQAYLLAYLMQKILEAHD